MKGRGRPVRTRGEGAEEPGSRDHAEGLTDGLPDLQHLQKTGEGSAFSSGEMSQRSLQAHTLGMSTRNGKADVPPLTSI